MTIRIKGQIGPWNISLAVDGLELTQQPTPPPDDAFPTHVPIREFTDEQLSTIKSAIGIKQAQRNATDPAAWRSKGGSGQWNG